MARYAEWNEFIQNLKTDKYGETNVNEVGIAFKKAAADVISKEFLTRKEDEAYNRGYEEANGEVERLEHILTNYALQYGTAMEQREVIDRIKTEVAREIFEGIEREINLALESNYKAKRLKNNDPNSSTFINIVDGKITALRGIDDFIAELKKKYTEATDDN